MGASAHSRGEEQPATFDSQEALALAGIAGSLGFFLMSLISVLGRISKAQNVDDSVLCCLPTGSRNKSHTKLQARMHPPGLWLSSDSALMHAWLFRVRIE